MELETVNEIENWMKSYKMNERRGQSPQSFKKYFNKTYVEF